MNSPFSRVYAATGCRSQAELGKLLGIRQSSVADAKKRGGVPADWLLTLLRLRGINPDWVLTGDGPCFVKLHSATYECEAVEVECTAREEVLRRLPAKELADELLRRIDISRVAESCGKSRNLRLTGG